MLSTLQDLYVDELKDLYTAEHLVLKALPKMEQAATSSDLKNAFQMHLEQTRSQIQRLEQIFRRLNTSPQGKDCKGMQGIVQEGDEFLAMRPDPWVCDAGLISMAQRVEHYEMAGYGCCRTWAKELDFSDDADLLQETLDEEGASNEKLNKIAMNRGVNRQAARKAA